MPTSIAMASKVIGILVSCVTLAQHTEAQSYGKAMAKFAHAGLVNRGPAVANHGIAVAHVNQPTAVLKTLAKLENENQELKLAWQGLRARVKKVSQTRVQGSQEGFGFGDLVGLLALGGLAASVGVAAARKQFGQGQHDTELNLFSQVPQRAGPILASASADVPSIIVGGGRIGNLLKDIGVEGDVVLKRGEPFPSSPSEGPIYVCTRNDSLQGIIDSTPPERRADLCFLQNGMLGSFLEANGLAENTQVLLYLAVSKLGEKPIDGITEFNPDGLTAATGKWADAFAARLANGDLKCRSLVGDEYKAAMLEKHVWICSFMMVGALNGGITVGEVGESHSEQLKALVAELCASGEEAFGIKLPDGAFDRLLAYGRSVAHFPTAVKELEWRNGWFYALTEKALAAGKPDPTPIHTAGLKTLGQID